MFAHAIMLYLQNMHFKEELKLGKILNMIAMKIIDSISPMYLKNWSQGHI